MVVNARLAGLLGPAGRGRSWTALSIEWPLPKAVNLTSAIFTFHTLTVGVAQCGVWVRRPAPASPGGMGVWVNNNNNKCIRVAALAPTTFGALTDRQDDDRCPHSRARSHRRGPQRLPQERAAHRRARRHARGGDMQLLILAEPQIELAKLAAA